MTEKTEKVNECQIDFLKPCPLCGTDFLDVHIDRLDKSYIECPDCKLKLIIDSTHCSDASVIELINGLIRKWNRRVA